MKLDHPKILRIFFQDNQLFSNFLQQLFHQRSREVKSQGQEEIQ